MENELKKCTMCGKVIKYGRTLCNECRDKRNYHAAIVSTNKKRLIKTLTQRGLTRERLNIVKTQCENIIKNGEIILTYKKIKQKNYNK